MLKKKPSSRALHTHTLSHQSYSPESAVKMLFTNYLSVLPVLMGLAAPAMSSPVNVTESVLDKRASTVLHDSKDGVDGAGFYYSLYNDNKASVGYTEYSDSGRFELGWNTPNKEFLGGKGFRGGAPR